MFWKSVFDFIENYGGIIIAVCLVVAVFAMIFRGGIFSQVG